MFRQQTTWSFSFFLIHIFFWVSYETRRNYPRNKNCHHHLGLFIHSPNAQSAIMDYSWSGKNMMAKDDIFIYKNDKQEAMAEEVGWEPQNGNVGGGQLRCEDKDGYWVQAGRWERSRYMMERWMEASMDGQMNVSTEGREGERKTGRIHTCMDEQIRKQCLFVRQLQSLKIKLDSCWRDGEELWDPVPLR